MASYENAARLRLLVIGSYGCGKSSTCNTLLRRTCFEVSSSSSTEDREILSEIGKCCAYEYLVVDGPAIGNVDKLGKQDYGRKIISIVRSAIASNEVVIAFLFVLRFGMKYTAEEKETLDFLNKILGESFTRHLIVIMTGGDYFQRCMKLEGHPDSSFEDWCKRQKGDLGSLYKACDRRFVLVNNTEKVAEQNCKQIHQIIDLAVKMDSKYSKTNLDDAAKHFDTIKVKGENNTELDEDKNEESSCFQIFLYCLSSILPRCNNC